MWTKSLYHNMLCPFITQWMPSRQKCWYTSSKCKRNINLNPVSYDYEPCFRNWGNLAIQGIGSGTLTKFMMLVRFCLSFWEQTSNDNGQKIWSVNLEITYSGKDRPWFLEKKKKTVRGIWDENHSTVSPFVMEQDALTSICEFSFLLGPPPYLVPVLLAQGSPLYCRSGSTL